MTNSSTPIPQLVPRLRPSIPWILAGLVLVLIAAFIDREIALFGATLPWEFADAARVLTELGEAQWIILPAVLLFIYGWRAGCENLARWAFLLGVTVAASGAIANVLKIVCGRWRPAAFIEGTEFGFEWFEMGSIRASFPSGHATTASCAALIFALCFAKWRWAFLLLGVAVASTRLVLAAHYLSDVVAGWMLGAACVAIALWIWSRVSATTLPKPMTISFPRTPVAIVWTAILVGTLLRVLIGIALPLGIDEAYEVATCQSVALSGFDHPPLVYWLTRLGLWLNGDGAINAIWIRTPFIVCFAISSWLSWRLGSICFSAAAGAWTVVLLNLSALFTIALGGWALPDGPLLVSLLTVALILVRGGVAGPIARPIDHPWSPYKTWIFAGIALGIAALAKYQAILTAFGVLVFLLSTAHGRRLLRHPAPWLGALVALSFTAPIMYWNATNEWASFRFQGGRAASAGGFHPFRLLELLGAQAGIILPWIWAPLVFEWLKAVRVGRANLATWFLVCIAGVPVLFFLSISLWGPKGLPHWSAVGYLFAFPLLGAATAHELLAGKRALVRNWMVFSGAILLLIVPIGVSQARSGWMNRMIPAMSQMKDPTLEALPWSAVRSYIQSRIATRSAINANFVAPPAPNAVWSIGTPDDWPCDEEFPQGPLFVDAFATPTQPVSKWRTTLPKVTRPARVPDPLLPLTEFEVDILARCGDEGIAKDGFFLAGVNWRDTGKLAVAVHGLNIPVACIASDRRQFAWTTPQENLLGRDALVIVRSVDAASAERHCARHFASFAPIAVLRLTRGTSIADQLTVFCGINFDDSSTPDYGR